MRTLAVVLFFGLVALAAALTESEYQYQFHVYVNKHNKQYTAEEFSHKYNAFKWNYDYIEYWNAQNSTTVLGLNYMSDLTNAEYQRIYLGTKIDASATKRANPFVNPQVLADTVDWRTKGAVTGVKNQQQCGSCWSFSTTGSVEGVHFLSKHSLVSLSEQNLVDCSGKYGNQGCNGGLMDNAFKYIIANKGIDTEASYPYTAHQGTCRFNAANVGATISSYKDVVARSESDLAASIMKNPVSVAIDASHSSFQNYHSGVYYEPACSASQLDHGVLAVGYNADSYIVKNSWGASWGSAGYIMMARNRNNNCGIATQASYPIA